MNLLLQIMCVRTQKIPSTRFFLRRVLWQNNLRKVSYLTVKFFTSQVALSLLFVHSYLNATLTLG